MLYKVEMLFIYGWDDAGWEEGESDDTELKPLRFHSRDEAQVAIHEFFTDVKAAVAAGDMDLEGNPEDYRIVETAT
ncbi:MAG TPA: hypothetical protein VGH19_02365 [Verrucomicrobiae bacterium]